MFVVAPYDTDVALDYRPWATGALIAVNIAVMLFLGYPDPTVYVESPWREAPEPPFVNSLVLEWGTINPIEWVTHSFVHFDFIHILFNMIFLWTFGLVVEGAVGWKKFLALYGLAAVGTGALLQLLMLGADDGWAAGASAGVSGLLAVAALWAPKNKLRVFVWILVIIRKPEVSVLGFCALWLGLDVVWVLFSGFKVSGAFGHVAGAAIGLYAGVVMLRNKWVDCQGWDYLSLREKGLPRYREPVHQPDVDSDLLARFRTAMEEEDGHNADVLAQRLVDVRNDWSPQKSELLTLIRLLRRSDLERCAERMREFIGRYPSESTSVRIMLADVLVDLGRPTAARDELDSLHDHLLSHAQREAKARVQRRAGKRPTGGLELE